MFAENSTREQRQRYYQLTSIALAVVTLALFGWLGVSAYDRAINADAFPPTATVPSDLGANLAQVSGLAGNVQRKSAGEDQLRIVRVGDTIAAGAGSVVQVSGLGYVSLSLANRAVLYLDDNTEFELTNIEGETTGVLADGRLLLNNPQRRNDFSFSVATGAMLNASGNTLAGINYDRETQTFSVDCLRGTCQFIGGDGSERLLVGGQRGESVGIGSAEAAGEARFDLYQSIGAFGSVPTPTRQRATAAPPTETPLPAPTDTPTLEPTATLTPTVPPTETPTNVPTVPVTPTVTATTVVTPTIAPTEDADDPEPTQPPATVEPTESLATAVPTQVPTEPTATATPEPPAATDTPSAATATPEPPTATPEPPAETPTPPPATPTGDAPTPTPTPSE